MILDNFAMVRELINFSKPNSMYFIQLLMRRKDMADLEKSPQKNKIVLYYQL